MQASYNASLGALFDVLHWDNLSMRRKKSKANLMLKILNGEAPTYLQDFFLFVALGIILKTLK